MSGERQPDARGVDVDDPARDVVDEHRLAVPQLRRSSLPCSGRRVVSDDHPEPVAAGGAGPAEDVEDHQFTHAS
jgi:hypothetical protein